MVRGPRRTTPVVAGTPAPASRRLDRKMAKVLAQSHGGFAGKNIIELLEGELTEVCVQYLVLRESDVDPEGLTHGEWEARGKQMGEARGRIRGLAIAVAMMRHPLRRHESVWWQYIKKLEKRHVALAKEKVPLEQA